ncbi:hypothetical protein [Bradyrhizobium vignae]|uniref:hypothetical protein n=1 Tax=Bradyrhizobium TaxID=374 RepID=UPI00100B5294|nr:hypothetical protein [Bradyrhizobium vignae]RXH01628.1 hypothetical protein EAV90_17450 [Bradyrhizobium vignae]
MRDVDTYDYTKIPAEHREEVRRLTMQIRASIRSSIDCGIDAGKALIEVKSKLQKGEFLTYCKEAYTESLRTLQNYMNVARLSDCYGPEAVSKVPSSIAYKLGAKGVAPELVEAILAEIAAGDIPTFAIVVERINETKGSSSRSRRAGVSPEELDRLAVMLVTALSSAQLASFVGFLAGANSSAIGELGKKCGLLGGATEAPIVPRQVSGTIFG